MTPDFKNAFTSPRTRLSLILLPHPVQQRRVPDLVETRLDVGLQHPLMRSGWPESGSRRSRPARGGSAGTHTSTA